MSGHDQPDRCADCTTRPTCWINGICVIKRDSAKVEAPTPEADAQDSSYRADKLEISRLYSKLAVQSKLTRDAATARDRLADELCRANDSLIAAREQIAALVADQRESDADRAREMREYVTTKQFHQQQASMAPAFRVNGHTPNCASLIVLTSYPPKYQACDCTPKTGNPVLTRGVSIPAAELDVTAEEDEAFSMALAMARYQDKVASGELKTTASDANHPENVALARSSAEIRLDDIERRFKEFHDYANKHFMHALDKRHEIMLYAQEINDRLSNAYLILQGRVNTHHDRLDALKDI